MSYKKYKMRKSLYFADKKDLAWMLFKKILFKTERYDITDDTTFDFNFKNLLKKY
jgi:hypothetical protein